MTRAMPVLSSVLLLCLAGTAQAQAVTPGGPVVPPLPVGPSAVDPVARAMAAKALAEAEALAIVKTTVVGTDVAGTPAVTSAAGTLGSSRFQAVGSQPGNIGYTGFKYGDDEKGVANYWVKTRGTTPNSYGAVQAGDRVVADYWQAGTGGQTGHVGVIQVTIDNATFTAGEVAGRWALSTGTGIHSTQASKQYPTRWGTMRAIIANSYQQILFPGGANAATPGNGTNFGGWVVIGAGAPSPGFGALKFLSSGAALLTTPEPGAFEVDATARPYFTAADGVRRGFVLADPAAPVVRVLAQAGSGATARIDANGPSGVVTLTTGTGAGTGTGGGDLFAVTYAHPYASASYPVVSAANAAAVALVKSGYLTATAAGFTLSLPAGTAASANTAYAVTFYAPGR